MRRSGIGIVGVAALVVTLVGCGVVPDRAARSDTRHARPTAGSATVPGAASVSPRLKKAGGTRSDDAVREVIHDATPTFPVLGGLVWEPDASGLLAVTVPGGSAERVWTALRGLVDRTGRWPVVLGAKADDYPGLEGASAADIIDTADRTDLGGYLRERAAELGLDTSVMSVRAVSEGPRYTGHLFFSVREPGSDAYLPAVRVVLVPDRRPWTVAAYLGVGGWNDCPEPAVHVALMHRWFDAWGAVPFAVDGDVLELYVAVPPDTPQESIPLAQEQYVYDYDIVDQSDLDGDREGLASGLIGYHSWQFWWD